MTERSNADAAAAAYQAWIDSKSTDGSAFLALMHDDVSMRTVLRPEVQSAVAGARSGKAAAKDYFDSVQREWEYILYEVERIIGDGDEVVMVGRCAYRNRATGGEVDTPKVDVLRFRDGKVWDFLEMFDSLEFDRALSP